MPEGFSSVADLKVIVDANAEKFHSGLQGVMSAVDAVSAKGGESFGGLQMALNAVGDVTLGVRGKINMVIAGLEAGLAVYQQFVSQGRDFAEMLGVEAEYDDLTESLEDLGLSLKDAVVGGFFAAQGAATEASDSMLGFSSSTMQASAESESFATRVLTALAARLRDAALEVRLFAASWSETAKDLDPAIEGVERKMHELNEQIKELESRRPEDAGWFDGAHIRRAKQELAEYAAELEKLQALGRNRIDMPWDDATEVRKNYLVDEIQKLQDRNATLGMSAAAAAEYEAMLRVVQNAQRDGITLTEGDIKANREWAREIGQLTQQRAEFEKAKRDSERAQQQAEAQAQGRQRAEASIFNNAEREILALTQRSRALGMNAEEAARLNMEERILQQLRAQNVVITDAEIIKARALANEYANMTAAASEHAEALQYMEQVGGIVSGNLQSAFRRWAEGGKADVKDMIASILSDLAMLTLQRNVLEPLLGGGSTKGGGLLGDLIGGIIGGARADGGPVDAGVPYLVGERGPELFVPRQSGGIVPNGGFGGGAPPISIVTQIDARGATTDAVQRLEQKMAERDSRLEGDVTRIIANTRDRNIA